jgi:PAS domain S-box-containing protein
LLESAAQGVVIVDRDGRVVRVNERLATMFGYSRDELQGQRLEMLVPAELRAAHASHRTRYAADPHVRPMGLGLDLTGQRKDCGRFPVEISVLQPVVLRQRPVRRRFRPLASRHIDIAVSVLRSSPAVGGGGVTLRLDQACIDLSRRNCSHGQRRPSLRASAFVKLRVDLVFRRYRCCLVATNT